MISKEEVKKENNEYLKMFFNEYIAIGQFPETSMRMS